MPLDTMAYYSHNNILILWHRLGKLHPSPETMGTLQRGNNALEFSDHFETLQTFKVIGDNVFGSASVFQISVFGANGIVVKACVSATLRSRRKFGGNIIYRRI
jgi:hypothetical protein